MEFSRQELLELPFPALFGFTYFLLLICMSCLHILNINPCWSYHLHLFFSHSVGCLFVLSMEITLFAMQNF